MKDKISVLIEEERIKKRVEELGLAIGKDYAGEELLLIIVLKGSVIFASDLAKNIPDSVSVTMDFMSVSSYGSGTVSSGKIDIKKDIETSIEGKNVLVIEDIVDTGNTLSYLLEILKERKPKSLKLCTLLNKPSRRVREVEVHYVGFEIPDAFVVGMGLDYDQKYRNLPYVGVVEQE